VKSMSLKLSDQVFTQSAETAKKLGISRMAFVRQAIEHEIERIEKQQELEAIAFSLAAIKAKPEYWQDSAEWQKLPDPIPESDAVWWK